MSFINHTKRNPVIKTITVATFGPNLQLATNPIVDLVGDRFILEIDQEVPYGVVLPAVLYDVVETFPMYDRYGNYIRADRLYSAIEFRKMGLLPFNGCSPYQFQAVIGTDPDRINILCCLPRSNYVPTPTPPASV